MKWYDDPKQLVARLREAGTFRALAEAADAPSRWTLQRRYKRLVDDALGEGGPVWPEPIRKPLVENELRLEGDGAITADWHIPICDYELAQRFCDDADRLGKTRYLVVAGDFWNMDALSDYAPKQSDAGFPVEIQHGQAVMQLLLDVFDKIYVTLGNHDERVLKKLGYKLRFEHCVKMLLPDLSASEQARIETTGRDYVIIDTDEGPWRVCHTKSYARTPLTTPAKLADIYQMHVAGAHRHHHAIGTSAAGFQVLELGGMFDASRTAYLDRYTNAFPKWAPGYSFLIGGRPYCPNLHATP